MAAQQVGHLRDLGPGPELGRGGRRRAAAGQRRRHNVQDGGTDQQRSGGAGIAQQDPVTDVQRQRVAQRQASESVRHSQRRRCRWCGERTDAGYGAGGADVQGQLGWQAHVGPGGQAHVHCAGHGPAGRIHEGNAARGHIGGDATQVERYTRHPADLGHRLAEGLDAADADRSHRRGEQEFLTHPHSTGRQRAGDHGSAPPDAERPVHPQPHWIRRAGNRQRRHQASKGGAELGQAVTGDGADRYRLHPAQAGAADPVQRLGCRRARVGQVAAGDGEEAVLDAHRVDGGEVLGGLRHPAAVGGDNEQHRGDRADACQHVRHEPLVARHVHEGDPLSARQAAPREAEIDRQPAALFLRPPVRFHPRQRPDQRRLPMIHMPRRSDDVHGHGVAAMMAATR